MTVNGTPKPTERSEGGSRRLRTPRRIIYSEQIVVRISKTMMVGLEDAAFANDVTLGQAVREAVAAYLKGATL